MTPRLTRMRPRLLTAAVAAIIYLAGLGGPALWEPDEGRYAAIARAMALSGDYVTPRNDSVRYFEKPPLIYWASAGAIKLLGRSEFAVRSQAALASVGAVVVTQILAASIAGETVGLLAALALGLSPLFFIFARFASPDPALALFLTAGLASFYRAAQGDFRRRSSRYWMWCAAVMLALGTLAKGPVALVLGALIGLLWLLLEGRARRALATIRWPECVGIYLAITAPWFVLVAARNPGFLQFFVIHEHWQRFTASTEHGWGPWFFVPVVVLGTWPFFYFVPLGLCDQFGARNTDETAKARSAVRFLVVWFAVIFVFFSIPRSKLGEYILPGIPPLAILAAIGLNRLAAMESATTRRIFGWYAAINLAAAMAVAAWLLFLRGSGFPPARAIFPLFYVGTNPTAALASDCGVLAMALAIPASLGWLSARNTETSRTFRSCVAFTAILVAGVLIKARVDGTPLVSYRDLAATIAPRLHEGCALVSYHHFVQSLPFYTENRELLVGYRGELAPFGDSPDAVATFIPTDARLAALWSGPRCLVLVVNRGDLPRIGSLSPRPVPIACEGKKIAVTNRAQASGSGSARGCAETPTKGMK